MSRTDPSRYDGIAMLVPCPTCRAPRDSWCIVGALSGLTIPGQQRWAAVLHADRGGDLTEAYNTGYVDGQRAVSDSSRYAELSPEALDAAAAAT